MSMLFPRCPRCHQGMLFAGALRVVDQCSGCQLPLKEHDAGDGPAFFVILVMGFLVMFLAGYVEYKYEPPMWLHAALWLPFTLIGCLIGLRWAKAFLIGLELKTHRMETPMTSRYVRPSPLAWLFFIGAFATTVGLGTWQVQRLAWKEGLIAEIEAAKENAPLTLKDLPTDEAGWKEKNFWPVKLTGTWNHEIEYHLAPRYYKNQLGYHLVEPLILADQRVVLVNRGWVPAAKKDIEKRARSIGVGRETVTGMIRYGSERNPFTPVNQKEKNIWFGRDVQEMAALYDVKNVLPIIVDQVGEQNAEKLPVPSDGAIHLRNDHLTYILTWYSIAAGILIIFLLSHRKKA